MSTTTELSPTEQKAILFLELLFGDGEGYICVASRSFGLTKGNLNQAFFQYPNEIETVARYALNLGATGDVWFCPQLFSTKERTKAKVCYTGCLWADLDTCAPSNLKHEPSITVESSPGRWQGYWILDGDSVEPTVAEHYSKRIAYYYAEFGCDRSGWDLTQLLRFPYTNNYKYYDDTTGFAPPVAIRSTGPKYTDINDFDFYPAPPSASTGSGGEMPEELPDFNDCLVKHNKAIPPAAFLLLHREPKGDWSKALWNLVMMLLEADIDMVDTFVLAEGAACNKYERDNRSSQALWADVCKAYDQIMLRDKTTVKREMEPLLFPHEWEAVAGVRTIIDDYLDMAKEMTDAAPEYHQAGILTLLSNILTDKIVCEVEYGDIIPNLWFLILADTTLTRKTTSMDIAMDILEEVNPDGVVATDGSLEGIFHGLSLRSGKPSIFLRDEFSGLIDSMAKKEYYAGMLEMFAKLYDGKYQKKLLRSGTIEIRKPMFQIYGGGIRSRIMELLTPHHVDSGFLPRFIMIMGDVDIKALRPIGPKRQLTMDKREAMVTRLQQLNAFYDQTLTQTIAGVQTTVKKVWHVELTPEAWKRFQIIEAAMNSDAVESDMPETLTPMYARMTISGLKVAMLLAAEQQRDPDGIVLDELTLLKAFSYVDIWRRWTYDVCKNIGKGTLDVQMEKVLAMGKRSGVVNRSEVMKRLRLTNRNAEELLSTMEQRGLLVRAQQGRDQVLTLTERGIENG